MIKNDINKNLFKGVLIEKKSIHNSVKHFVLSLFNDCTLYKFKEKSEMDPSIFLLKDKNIFAQIEIYDNAMYFNYSLIREHFNRYDTQKYNIKIITNEVIRYYLQKPNLTIIPISTIKGWKRNQKYIFPEDCLIHRDLLKKRIGIFDL